MFSEIEKLIETKNSTMGSSANMQITNALCVNSPPESFDAIACGKQADHFPGDILSKHSNSSHSMSSTHSPNHNDDVDALGVSTHSSISKSFSNPASMSNNIASEASVVEKCELLKLTYTEADLSYFKYIDVSDKNLSTNSSLEVEAQNIQNNLTSSPLPPTNFDMNGLMHPPNFYMSMNYSQEDSTESKVACELTPNAQIQPDDQISKSQVIEIIRRNSSTGLMARLQDGTFSPSEESGIETGHIVQVLFQAMKTPARAKDLLPLPPPFFKQSNRKRKQKHNVVTSDEFGLAEEEITACKKAKLEKAKSRTEFQEKKKGELDELKIKISEKRLELNKLKATKSLKSKAKSDTEKDQLKLQEQEIEKLNTEIKHLLENQKIIKNKKI